MTVRPDDYGDRYPSDTGDVSPVDKTDNFSERDYTVPKSRQRLQFTDRVSPFVPVTGAEDETLIEPRILPATVLGSVNDANAFPRRYWLSLSDGSLAIGRYEGPREHQDFASGDDVIVERRTDNDIRIVGQTHAFELYRRTRVAGDWAIYSKSNPLVLDDGTEIPLDDTFGKVGLVKDFKGSGFLIETPGWYELNISVILEHLANVKSISVEDVYGVNVIQASPVYLPVYPVTPGEHTLIYTPGVGYSWSPGDPPPPGSPDIESGLVGYWILDEGTGTTAADSSGNGLDFTSVNDSWNADHPSGSGNSYVTSTSAPTLSQSDDPLFTIDAAFTFATWMKTSDSAGGSIAGQFDDLGGGNFSEPWMFLLGTDGKLSAKVNDQAAPGNTNLELQVDTVANDGNWHHIAMVFDNGTLTIYFDGTVPSTTTSSGGPVTSLFDSTGVFTIGSSGPIGPIAAKFAQSRFYTRALSQADIMQLVDNYQ